MRELKFRARQANGEWLYSEKCGLDLFFTQVLLHKLETQQFTGLKDKNGKEIAQGDILRFGCQKPYEVKYDEGVASFDIQADFCTIRIQEGLNQRGHVKKIDIDYPEIIGNIYDNPELIKEVT
jgi:uncharacterized phage protein (TIGR01671 family)